METNRNFCWALAPVSSLRRCSSFLFLKLGLCRAIALIAGVSFSAGISSWACRAPLLLGRVAGGCWGPLQRGTSPTRVFSKCAKASVH